MPATSQLLQLIPFEQHCRRAELFRRSEESRIGNNKRCQQQQPAADAPAAAGAAVADTAASPVDEGPSHDGGGGGAGDRVPMLADVIPIPVS